MARIERAAGDALNELARRPAHGSAFAEDVMGLISGVVPFDGYALLGLDPLTGLRSFMFSRNGLDGVADRLAHNETVEKDVNRYADLARAACPAGVLNADGRGGPRSPRLHEILRPAGFASELRLALRSGGSLWGALVLFRADRRRPFGPADIDAATAIEAPLAAAIRRYAVRDCPHPHDPVRPGVVTLDGRNQIVTMSSAARAWLEDVRPGGSDEVEAVDILRVVYDAGLAVRTRDTPAMCRVRTTSGRWLFVNAEWSEPDSTSVTVVLQPAAIGQVLPAASAWLGLTRREREVLDLVAAGLPAKLMSKRLGLSVLTVNEHLGSVYRKAGVAGREELLARLS